MQADDYLLIEQYLDGTLAEREKTAFAERLATEPDLAAALREREAMQRYLKFESQKDALAAQMGLLGKQYFGGDSLEQGNAPSEAKVRPIGQRWWVAALAAAAVIALVLLVFNPFASKSGQQLYAEYATHEPISLTERSNEAPALAAAETAFNQGDYERAYALLKEVPGSPQSQFAQAICAMETERTAEARSLFQELANGSSVYKNYGHWYLALSYLKTEGYEQARAALAEIPKEDDYLFTRAQELLKALP